jgi:integrase
LAKFNAANDRTEGKALRLDIIRGILGTEDAMPRKYQNPKLEIREDVERPYYFVRVTVPVFTEDGRRLQRQRRILGFVDEMTATKAKQERARLLEIVNAGRVLVQSQIRFKDIARRFLDVRVPQLGFAAQKKYRTQIENHILPAFGELRMCDIDRPAVEAWLNAKEQEGLGWWSRIDLKGVLSGIFTTAGDWKLWSGENPTKGVRIGKKRLVHEKRLLTVDELRAILGAVSDRAKFIVLILFGVGLRISEALGLKWRDIDFDNGVLSIRRRWYRGDLSDDGETKSDKSCRVAQLGPLVEEFRRRYPGPQAREQFVFIGDDGVMPPDDRDLLRYEFRPILKRLKLYYPGFGWHAFRRQNVTWRQQVGGATPFEAQRAAGHGSLDMTYLYTLADAERERAQVQAIFDKLMAAAPDGKPQ